MPTDIVPIKHLKDPVKDEFSGGEFFLNRPWRAGNVQFGDFSSILQVKVEFFRKKRNTLVFTK